MLPLVSVCCITFNHEAFIRNTVEGFLMQNTTFPIEIIIHDDASTDGTANIVKKYADNYPHLIVPILQTENQWSKGIRPSPTYVWPRARGKYIALCEGDDYWTDPLKLQKQVDFLENNSSYNMHCHNALVIYQNSIAKKHFFNEDSMTDTLTFKDILREWKIPTASMMFRRSTIQKIPAWFSSLYNGDYGIGLMVSEKGKVKYSNEVMSVYRKHFGALSFDPQITSEYALPKLIQLFNYLNIETEFKYKEEIQQRINKLEKTCHKLKIKRKYPFLYPKFLMKIILLKFGYSVFTNPNTNLFDFKILNLRKLRRI